MIYHGYPWTGLTMFVSNYGFFPSKKQQQDLICNEKKMPSCNAVDQIVRQHEVDVAVNVSIGPKVFVVTARVALTDA